MRGVTRVMGGTRGAALLTVLLLMVLVFMLISTMLLSATKEILIAGLHRDAVRADEHAQAGLEDVLRRLEASRPWKPGAADPSDACTQADGSRGVRSVLPGSEVCTTVRTRLAGPSGSFLEVRPEAELGRARRRLSTVLLARTATALPGVLIVHSLTEDANIEVGSGEVHAQTFVRYVAPLSAGRTTYAGWRIREGVFGPGAGPCYTRAECFAAGHPQWWPGHRRAVYGALPLRPSPLSGNPTPDPRMPAQILAYGCPAGPPVGQVAQVIGADGPGYQIGDRRADLNPTDPLQDVVALEPLYGCTADGFPYTWVREGFDSDDDLDGDPDQFLWFKVVLFDQWLARYWCFDEGLLSWTPCNGFNPDPGLGDPGLGAVLPLIPLPVWAQNYDQLKSGGGSLTPADLDLGSCADPPLCGSSTNGRPVIALKGDFTLLCPGACPEGLGVLLVDGNLTINGELTYRGTVIVRGVLTLGSGIATIHGTLSARGVANVAGTLRLFPGTRVASGAAGPVAATRRAWWER